LKLFSKRSNFQKAKKYSTILTRESFMKLISRVTRDNDLGLTIDILDQFIRDMHESLKCSDFLLIANVTKKQLSPDENLRVFSNYQDRYTKAETAYLYLLFDYEMIEMAGEYLDEHDIDEFIRFRGLYGAKKDLHKGINLPDLITFFTYPAMTL